MPQLERPGGHIRYEIAGTGPTILFTHGLASGGAIWDGIAATLQDRYRVITWDLRGHGGSAAPADADFYSEEAAMSDMAALLDAAGAAKAVLVGYSVGGFLSLRFALDHPERVQALVLQGAGPGFKNADAEREWNEGVVGRWAKTIEEKGIEIFAADVPEVRRVAHSSAQGLALAVRGFGTRSGDRVIRGLTEIAVPVLCLAGEKDTLMGAASGYLAKKIPGARNEVIPNAGHGAHMDNPDAFLAALEPFLAEVCR